MNPLIERIEHLKNVGTEAVNTFPAITSVTLGVVHEDVDELIEAAKHFGKELTRMENSGRLLFLVNISDMKITISVSSKDAIKVTTLVTPDEKPEMIDAIYKGDESGTGLVKGMVYRFSKVNTPNTILIQSDEFPCDMHYSTDLMYRLTWEEIGINA